MNIFDLSGPAFLAAYAAIAAGALVVAHRSLVRMESGGEPPLLKDGYEIAYLRGGAREVLRVAMLSLLDRGLLVVDDSTVRWRTPGQPPVVRHPVEQLVVRACGVKCSPEQIFSTRNLQAVTIAMAAPLRAKGLLPATDQLRSRMGVFLLAVGVLWGVAGYKLVLAAQRGRSNVLFLVLLAIFAAVAAGLVVFRRRTTRGTRALDATRQLLAGLRQRSNMLRPGHDPVEVLQLAAVFGVAAVPLSVFPHRGVLGPEPARPAGKSNDRTGGSCGAASTSSCGSSCSSSSSSSCGSSCGGGCGGCGS